jgi:diguanylate cyclase (GGDEF)-like protein
MDPGADVPENVRKELSGQLFDSSAALTGAVLNTAAVACLVAVRIPTWPFILFACLQTSFAAGRLLAHQMGARSIRAGQVPRPDFFVAMSILWSAVVGYGSGISIVSGDWVVATLSCVSAAAMVGGICLRNFAAPRLAVAMIVLSLGPCSVAALFSGEWIMLLTVLQLPLYLYSMGKASLHLNKLLVRTMRTERLNDHLARHDDLTGVLNRTGLNHWLKDVVSRQSAETETFALFFLDLDGFKAVNDTLGHATGDHVLKEVAERLKGLIRSQDAIARLGGDEFVLVSMGEDEASAKLTGSRIVEAIASQPFLCGSEGVTLGVSAGAALYPAQGTNLPSLLMAADIALYEAKSANKPSCKVSATINTSRRPPAQAIAA